ncbi:hypothetical protein LWI29_034199 [Acer saccharum]|uniref:Uncharacterized protein n=1 Tax=Acer saccharum TaxID=4024 RepID=A0AA39TYN0_ACESA|nr:hypothetical protein LWI29_034199 [Acer saccharum]
MDPLPQGFNKKKVPEEGSLLNRHFKEKRPTVDLLYATMKRLTSDEDEDEDSSDEDQDQNFKLDGVDESMYNHRTTTSFVRSPDDPPSRKKLFDDTDFQTHKSTFHTSSLPSTIADLYLAIASLIKESDSKTDRDGELLFKQVEKNDVQADATCNVTAMEESVGQAEVASKSDGLASKIDFDKHSSDPWADAPAVSKMVEDVDNRTILDENELKEINNCVEFCIQEIVQKNLGDDPDAEGCDQGLKLNQIIQTLEGLRLQMDANKKANMTEFANLNHKMDAFQKALVHSGLQFPYVRGHTNGSENTPQQADHEITSPLSDP